MSTRCVLVSIGLLLCSGCAQVIDGLMMPMMAPAKGSILDIVSRDVDNAAKLRTQSALPDQVVAIDELAIDNMLPIDNGIIIAQLALTGSWGHPKYADLVAYSPDGEPLWTYPRSGSPTKVFYHLEVIGNSLVLVRIEAKRKKIVALALDSGEKLADFVVASEIPLCLFDSGAAWLDSGSQITVVSWREGTIEEDIELAFTPERLVCEGKRVAAVGEGLATLTVTGKHLQPEFVLDGGYVDVAWSGRDLATLGAAGELCVWGHASVATPKWCTTSRGGTSLVALETLFLVMAEEVDAENRTVTRMTAIDSTRGDTMWSRSFTGVNHGNVLLHRNTLFFALNGEKAGVRIHAADSRTGKARPPTSLKYVSTTDPFFYRFSAMPGGVLVQHANGAAMFSSVGTLVWQQGLAHSHNNATRIASELRWASRRLERQAVAHQKPHNQRPSLAQDSGTRDRTLEKHRRVMNNPRSTSLERQASIATTSAALRTQAAADRMNAGIGLGNSIAALGPAVGEAWTQDRDKAEFNQAYAQHALRPLALETMLRGDTPVVALQCVKSAPESPHCFGFMIIDTASGGGWCLYTDSPRMLPHNYQLLFGTVHQGVFYTVGAGIDPAAWRPVNRFLYRLAAPSLLMYRLDESKKLAAEELSKTCGVHQGVQES